MEPLQAQVFNRAPLVGGDYAELPHWTVPEAISYWTEEGNDTGREVVLDLIPYGCTTLRMAAFPSRIIPWDLSYREPY